jgi:hypothetical protein
VRKPGYYRTPPPELLEPLGQCAEELDALRALVRAPVHLGERSCTT